MAILTFGTEGSSRITGMAYDTDDNTLKVDFKRGGSYEYYEVSIEIYNAIKTAPSIGKAFDALIKNAGFKYKKV